LVKLLAQRRIELVFDIGAGTGGFATGLRNIGYGGRIISFEPCRSRYSHLHMSALEDSTWETVQCALGDHEGIIQMGNHNEIKNHDTANVNICSKATAVESPERNEQEDVVVSRISTLLPAFSGLQEKVFVRINVPGAELPILNGARSVIQTVSAFHVRIPLYASAHGTTHEKVTRCLKSMDFECISVVPFEEHDGNVLAFSTDATYVRR
jgi:FkbM family methyltransferase